MNDPMSALWLGTEESHWEFLRNEIKLGEINPAERMKLSLEDQKQKLYSDPEEFSDFDRMSYMLSRHGNLAVVNISGELTTRKSWYNRYAGRVSYAEIREAVVAAANDESIEGIVLDMDTPGGAATGIMELSDFMEDVDKKVKPIYTYTGTSMCSGGYWLGCIGRKIYASPMASVGSIGVVMAHQSYHRYLKELGIDATVFRSGEFKALGHSMESLSDKAEQTIQDSLDKTYGIFLDHVSDARGMSVKTLKQNAAEGRVFLASDAKEVGLVDKLAYFDQALSEISKKVGKKSDSRQPESQYLKGEEPMTKKVITEKAQAALASGVTEEQVLQDNELAPEVAEETLEATETEQTEGQQEVSESSESVEVEEAEEGVKADAFATQLASITKENAKLELQVESLEQQLSGIKTTQSSLMEIAVAATQKMQIALGSSPADMDKLDASTVVSMYHDAQEKFNSRFPVGAKAEVPTDSNQETLKREAGRTNSHLSTSGLTL
ncbi:signal peptide peptidase SppA [Endozoicomonas sp. ALC066]|uniref:signal peptide peptidase SppA n=1 Tax=Endozoicomonas sp. ALC066 TaxID=3403078 RepID=UPI003BB6B29A